MDRGDLQRLSKDELIELVMRLQRPDKTSRTVVEAALDGQEGNAGELPSRWREAPA